MVTVDVEEGGVTLGWAQFKEGIETLLKLLHVAETRDVRR